MHGVEPAAVHALEQDQVPAGIGDGDGDGDAGLFGPGDRGRRHLLCPAMGEALRCRDVHGCSSLDGAGKLHDAPGAIKAAERTMANRWRSSIKRPCVCERHQAAAPQPAAGTIAT